MEEEEGDQLNNDDASKAASDVAESPEQATANANADDDHTSATAGTVRSYECIFCKRGFSTAQALGGHMNIHRRDRTRVMKSSQAASASASSKRPHEDASEAANYGHYQPYPVHMRSSFNPPKSSGGSLPSSQYSTSMYGNQNARSCSTGGDPRRARELSLFGEELHLGLGSVQGDGGDGKGIGGGKEEEEEEELDLELRLGP